MKSPVKIHANKAERYFCAGGIPPIGYTGIVSWNRKTNRKEGGYDAGSGRTDRTG
ncbi:hypothetical protein GCM10008919_09740 [Selenomonas dianae]|uniref:Uncharacterized protein n=1 Tax=Selenomonas dianae TaxID=135079 RepID=A0ABN0T0H5_9FIRM